MRFKQVVGNIVDRNRAFRDHLLGLGIEVDYVETGCAHSFSCMLEREAGSDVEYLSGWLRGAAKP